MNQMSEEQEKKFKTWMREILQENENKKTSSTSEEEGHKTHATLSELLDCPNCYPEIKNAVIEKEFKDASHVCEECGLPVKGEESAKEDWKCPGCEHRFAKPK